jgi:hypothetical protein
MNNLLLIAQLLPILIQTIKAVEAAIPESGQGQTKLQMVRDILELVDESIPALWPILEKIIGVIVAGFNAAGLFKKAKAAP